MRGQGAKALLAAILPLKFSELLFILLYLIYFAPKRSFAPLKICFPTHGMFSSCGVARPENRTQVYRLQGERSNYVSVQATFQ